MSSSFKGTPSPSRPTEKRVSPRVTTYLPSHSWVAIRNFDAKRVSKPRPPVVHDHATIALYLQGQATFWMGKSYTLAAGDVLLVPPGMPHFVVETEGAHAVGLSLCLVCMASAAQPALDGLFHHVHQGGCAARHLEPKDRDRFQQLLVDLGLELRNGDRPSTEDTQLAIDGYLSLLTTLLLRADDSPLTQRSLNQGSLTQGLSTANPVAIKALSFIYAHATEGISLREVAAHVGRSAAHVATLIKEHTGETAVGWITRSRMRHGRQLLLHTDEPIDAIAHRCGFASPSHFHRAFKSAHGVPPGAWRRTQRAVRHP